MTPSADQSARILAGMLRARDPFLFVRLGDADVPWMLNRPGLTETCDGELYRDGLGADLMAAWAALCSSPAFLCGDLLTMEDPATPEVQADFRALCAPYPALRFLHSEAILMHRLSPALREFYRAVRQDTRRKVLIAPHRLAGAAGFLRAGFLPIHHTHAHEPGEVARAIAALRVEVDASVVLIAGGRATKLLAGYLSYAFGVTVIDLGSALDPLFYGRTRGAQVEQHEARGYMFDLIWEDDLR